MIHFFGTLDTKVFAVQTVNELTPETIAKLQWLFGDQPKIEQTTLNSTFCRPTCSNDYALGVRMPSKLPKTWVLKGLFESKNFIQLKEGFSDFDPMISEKFEGLHQQSFDIGHHPRTDFEYQ